MNIIDNKGNKPVIRNDLAIYDAAADSWWNGRTPWVRALHNLVPARLGVFDPIVGDWRGKRVLDLGCAGGFMAEAMCERGAVVSGIDPAERAIAAARSHASSAGHVIDYRVGVGEELPYDDAGHDIVVCVDVLEHVRDLDRVIGEVRRVLAPGGLFLFDTINRNPLASFAVVTMAENILKLLPKGTHDPAMFIRPSELQAKLERHGFEVGGMSGLGPRGVNQNFDPVFGELPFKSILYIGHATLT